MILLYMNNIKKSFVISPFVVMLEIQEGSHHKDRDTHMHLDPVDI